MANLNLRLGSTRFDLSDIVERLLPDLSDEVLAILDDPGKTDAMRPRLVDALPERFHFLIDPVSQLDSEHLSLFDLAKTGAPAGPLSFEIGGEARLRVRRVAGEGATYVAYGVTGNLEAGAAAAARAWLLSVGIDAKAHQARYLEYAVTADADAPVLACLRDLPHALVDPSDYSAIVSRMQDGRLGRVTRSGTGNNTLGVSVALNGTVSEALTDAGMTISGQIGASLALHYQDAAEFSLSVERIPTGYVIDLAKSRRVSTSSTLKLGVDVQLVGLKDRLLEKLTVALPDASDVRELLDRIDAEVEMLKEEHLRSSIDQALGSKWPRVKPLFAALLGTQDLDSLKDQLQGELRSRIDDILSSGIDVVNEKGASVADRVISRLAEELDLDQNLRSQLHDYLSDGLEKGVNAVQRAFSADEIAQRLLPDGKVAQYLAPLKGVSGAIDDVLKAAGKAYPKAKALTGALREIYERYNGFRSKVLDVVRNDLEENFALAVISEKSRTEATTRDLTLRVPESDADNPTIATIYQKLWNGDMRGLARLLNDLPAAVEVTGEYATTVERLDRMSFSLAMFGVGIHTRTLFSSKTVVGFDYLGRLTAASTQAEIERQFATLGPWSDESQNIMARWQIDFLNRSLLGRPLKITLTVKDDEFECKDEVAEFFRPLALAGITRPGLDDSVQHKLFAADHTKKLKDVVLSLSVSLSWPAWERLILHDAVNSLLLSYLQRVKQLGPDAVDEAQKYMREAGIENLPGYLLHIGAQRLEDAAAVAGFPSVLRPPPKFQMAYYLGRTFFQLRTAIERSRAGWLAVHDVVQSTGSTQAEIEDAMADFNFEFSRLFRGLLLRSAIDNRGAIGWRTAAVLGLFRGLNDSQDVPNPFIACTIKVGDASGRIFS